MKKLFTILAAALVVSLAACNSATETSTTDSDTTNFDNETIDSVNAPTPIDTTITKDTIKKM